MDGIKEEFLDDCSDRYWKLKESSHAYIINQFGLSCFKATSSSRLGGSGTCFEASTFNFYIFPEPLKDSNQVSVTNILMIIAIFSFVISFHYSVLRIESFCQTRAPCPSWRARILILTSGSTRVFRSCLQEKHKRKSRMR